MAQLELLSEALSNSDFGIDKLQKAVQKKLAAKATLNVVKTVKNWSAEFQLILELPDDLTKFTLMRNLVQDFVFTAEVT